jgi:hypothetical protein
LHREGACEKNDQLVVAVSSNTTSLNVSQKMRGMLDKTGSERRQPLIQQKCDDNLKEKIVSPQLQKEKGLQSLIQSRVLKNKNKKKKKKKKKRRRRTTEDPTSHLMANTFDI